MDAAKSAVSEIALHTNTPPSAYSFICLFIFSEWSDPNNFSLLVEAY